MCSPNVFGTQMTFLATLPSLPPLSGPLQDRGVVSGCGMAGVVSGEAGGGAQWSEQWEDTRMARRHEGLVLQQTLNLFLPKPLQIQMAT